jgi:hypothetical protein
VVQFTYFCQRHGSGFLELIHEDIVDRWHRQCSGFECVELKDSSLALVLFSEGQ